MVTYTTLGYYKSDEKAWIETYVFKNGSYAIYKWVKNGEEFLLERLEASFKSDYLNRNRWTKPTDGFFQIIEERSYDNGKTWRVNSVTKMIRVGKLP